MKTIAPEEWRKLEDGVAEARNRATPLNDKELYDLLDKALLRVQKLSAWAAIENKN
jgi:hypothetical protein